MKSNINFHSGNGLIIPAHPIGPNNPENKIGNQYLSFAHCLSFLQIKRHILLVIMDKAIYLE